MECSRSCVRSTAKSVEAWHHSFQRSLQCWHDPNLWKFIYALKKEERLQRLNINQLLFFNLPAVTNTVLLCNVGLSYVVVNVF